MDQAVKIRGAARPRAATTDAIRDACVAELTERGYHALSMESVARRAGVGKGALYRRWPDRAAMVVAVVEEITRILRPDLAFDDDDLESDLTLFAASVDRWLHDPRIIADLVSVGVRDADFSTALTAAVAAVLGPTREALRERAARRGDPDPADAMADITGAVFWRRAVMHQDLTDSDVAQLARRAARGATMPQVD
ncbi:TetR/AcrR family transcriptional regulator [Microbacterium sp. SORGH_AS_0421]|uniref:TetR/AcrR family transcriptional regulator n=1 Tax=Microbacterium sp. SORGH_AS_0421 TaxID=3041768 RepID=UPI0027942B0F|nr:TetR/AcrR family transcriptional regulator [Microbacterium sp. SORGH_AS_0421]MDQ1176363.1 AcrR family transcriptional regulator [Microbacterium sp. SORGH_AS_0421]